MEVGYLFLENLVSSMYSCNEIEIRINIRLAYERGIRNKIKFAS